MRISAFQFTPSFGDVPENLRCITARLAGVEADLVVLPELCTTGYQLTSGELERLAEPFPGGATSDALLALADREDTYLVAGVAERDGDRFYNSAVLVGPGGHVATYRKTHLFAAEKDLFEPGDTGFSVHEVRGCKVGMMVCFDWIFPESMRCLALLGADVVAHCANLVLPWCQRSMPLRCLENGLFAITANRCGTEARTSETLRFTGASQVVSPRGEVLAHAPEAEDHLLTLRIDPAEARDKWLTTNNHLLQDRRPALYTALASKGGPK
ncbi:MAG: nitrilase-related carbon-nitrogen hydrolase [bacterium]